EAAYNAAIDAIDRAPERADGLEVLLDAAAATGPQAEAAARLDAMIADRRDLVAPQVALSKLKASSGAFDEAIRIAGSAVQAHPDDAAAVEQLASIYADAGDADRLTSMVPALGRFSARPGSRYFIAVHHFLRS